MDEMSVCPASKVLGFMRMPRVCHFEKPLTSLYTSANGAFLPSAKTALKGKSWMKLRSLWP
jgi:hypothetical protein